MNWLPYLVFGIFAGGFQVLFSAVTGGDHADPIFLGLLVAPVVILFVWTRVVSRPISLLLMYLVVFMVIYTGVVGIAWSVDARLEAELQQYDLDADGIFSEEEQTPAQQEAFDRVINDLGRNLAPLTGIGIAADYAALVVVTVVVVRWLTRIRKA